MTEREREREREVVASIVTAVWRRRGARGCCLYAFPIVVFFSHSDHSAVCGLPWFFPHLGFHVNILCVLSSFVHFYFLCINRLLGCGRVQRSESNSCQLLCCLVSNITSHTLTNPSLLSCQILVLIVSNTCVVKVLCGFDLT